MKSQSKTMWAVVNKYTQEILALYPKEFTAQLSTGKYEELKKVFVTILEETEK
jgi:hypothetical protein